MISFLCVCVCLYMLLSREQQWNRRGRPLHRQNTGSRRWRITPWGADPTWPAWRALREGAGTSEFARTERTAGSAGKSGLSRTFEVLPATAVGCFCVRRKAAAWSQAGQREENEHVLCDAPTRHERARVRTFAVCWLHSSACCRSCVWSCCRSIL
jgi:hypothetical protein